MHKCTPKEMAIKFIILGLVIILARWFFPAWDIWIVLGVLALIKGLMIFFMPNFSFRKEDDEDVKRKRRR